MSVKYFSYFRFRAIWNVREKGISNSKIFGMVGTRLLNSGAAQSSGQPLFVSIAFLNSSQIGLLKGMYNV